MPKDKKIQSKQKYCVFCDIIDHKRQKNDIVLETKEVIVFHDASPAAKHHLLSCPVKHIKDCKHLTKADIGLVRQLEQSGMEALSQIGANTQDARIGFHLPPFTSVNHLHLHLISPAVGIRCLARVKYDAKAPWFLSVDEVVQHLQKSPEDRESEEKTK